MSVIERRGGGGGLGKRPTGIRGLPELESIFFDLKHTFCFQHNAVLYIGTCKTALVITFCQIVVCSCIFWREATVYEGYPDLSKKFPN